MPRMVDLVRKSQLSSNMMQAAARGALAVQPDEMMEILVHLALHNKVFGEMARMTLAGWDEKAAQKVAADPATNKEVLDYLISAKNIRPALLPVLLENPAIKEEELTELATNGTRTVVEAMLESPRVKGSAPLREALRSNPRLRAHERDEIEKPVTPEATEPPPAMAEPVAIAKPMAESAMVAPAAAAGATPGPVADLESAAEEALAEALAHFLEDNRAELATVEDRPFQPMGGMYEHWPGEAAGAEQHAPSVEALAEADAAGDVSKDDSAHSAALAAVQQARRPLPQEERRETTLSKISKLDVKGRIHLAIRGSKEERSILIRDGTKLVALAVLDSPKVSDGEVEGFAQQKNVLEAVLRAIPMKRRFAKNYTIMRNLVFNPRTPLDVSLGLMKGLLIHDLKNLSGNKEVSETIRKLALRMFKQKSEQKKKD
jgi:hypothetical protein